MRIHLLTVGLILASTVAAGGALVENFDTYISQADFQSVWKPWSVDGSSLQLTTAGRNDTLSVQGVAVANYQSRNARNLDSFTDYLGTDDTPVKFEFWMYDQNPKASNAGMARNFSELRAYAGDGVPNYGGSGIQGVIAMGLYNAPVSAANFHARVYYGGVNSWYNLNTPRTAGWHKLTSLIGSSYVQFYVDDVLDTTVPINPGKIYAFDGVVLGSGLTSGGYDTVFDDLSVSVGVSVVPEPLPVLLLAAGAVLLRRRARTCPQA